MTAVPDDSVLFDKTILCPSGVLIGYDPNADEEDDDDGEEDDNEGDAGGDGGGDVDNQQ